MPNEPFPHDAAYKEFFSDREMMRSLLEDFVTEEFVGEFDFDSLEICPGEYISEDLTRRQDDIVWRVKWRDSWFYIYLILEFQSAPDQWMALRILSYTAQLWEDLAKKDMIGPGGRLPPVFPIVIYNGNAEWKAPLSVQELIEPLDAGLVEYFPRHKYFLLDEKRLSDLLVDEAEGLSAYIFRIERSRTRKEFLGILKEFLPKLTPAKFDHLRRAVKNWASRLFRTKKPEEKTGKPEQEESMEMLEETVARWEEEIRNEGFCEGESIGLAKGESIGLEKGRIEGLLKGESIGLQKGIANQRDMLLEMLADRFDDLPAGWVAIISKIDDPLLLRQLIRSVWTVSGIEDFGDRLRGNK